MNVYRVGLSLLLAVATFLPVVADSWVLDNVDLIQLPEGKRIEDRAILIKDGRIESIVAAGGEFEAAAVIDGGGGHVIPGLVDLHVHLRADEDLRLFLAAGVTRVLDLNASATKLQLRDRVREGSVAGPHLHLCGGPITKVQELEAAREIVDGYAAQELECIKPYGDISAEALTEMVSRAREKGLFTIGHIPRNLIWEQMLAAKPAAIAHAEEFIYGKCCNEEQWSNLIEQMKQNPTALVATLSAYDRIGRQSENLEHFLTDGSIELVEPIFARDWRPGNNHYARRFGAQEVSGLRRGLAFQFKLIRRLNEGGATILVGTDAGNVGSPPGSTVHEELELLVAAGLSPLEALVAGTTAAYEFLGLEEQQPALTPGARAEFVVLGGNPLDYIGNVRLVRGVSVDGNWHGQEALERGRSELREINRLETELFDLFDAQGDPAIARRMGELDWKPRPRILNEFAYTRWYGGDRPQGLIYFEKNVELHPDHWMPHASLGETYDELGRAEDARRHYERAVALNPHYRP